MRAEDVEGKLLAGQRAEKRLLESSEVNDRWRRLTGERGGFVGMTGFGASGPAEVLYRYFGITPEAIVAKARSLLAIQPETATA